MNRGIKQIRVVEQHPTVAEQDYMAAAFYDVDGNPISVSGPGDSEPPSWGEVTGKPSQFPPSTHGHDVSEVTGLESRLADLEARLSAIEDAGD